VAARIVSIVGRKNAGKTTLTVALAGELARQGHRVMSVKHGHHPMELDRPGTDSWRHLHEGRVERALYVGPDLRVLFERAEDDYDPLPLIRRHLADADVVLVEGYTLAPLPKIEVHRRAANPEPLYDPGAAAASLWIAVVSDDEQLQAECPVLHFRDTMWLQRLAHMAWEHGLELAP
jgi:molybdopterin-guanine dinucleotide biosynthesis protein B